MVYSSQTLTGRYTPKRPEKYAGDVRNIVFRSSYELKFMDWCDTHPSVLHWGSEEVVVPYLNPLDQRMHRYFIDFFIEVRNKAGEVKRYLVEVKPSVFTHRPDPPKRKSKRFLQETGQYFVNAAKWRAAREFARKIGVEFVIITEEDLGIPR